MTGELGENYIIYAFTLQPEAFSKSLQPFAFQLKKQVPQR